jgi:O-antigen/teichoic acid export membrane protein
MYEKASKYLALLLTPLAASIIVFAPDFLRLWVGSSFAHHSTFVLQIMAIGFLANSLAVIPFTLIQGIGRVDITAKFNLLEAPIYLLSLWFGVHYLGIIGAAIALTARVGIDFFLLIFYVQFTGRLDTQAMAGTHLYRILGLSPLALVIGWLLQALVTQLLFKFVVWSLIIIVAAWLVWQQALTAEERRMIASYGQKAKTLLRGRFGYEKESADE